MKTGIKITNRDAKEYKDRWTKPLVNPAETLTEAEISKLKYEQAREKEEKDE